MSGKKAKQFLIIANSARFLAEAADGAGNTVVTIDAYADADLRDNPSLRECICVPVTTLGLDGDAVLDTCRALQQRYAFDGVIIGSGLDDTSGAIAELDRMFGCIGNCPEVFACCADRKQMRAVFNELDIPHAANDTSNDMPMLSKRSGASGGGHITWGDGERAEAYVPGTAVSHLFVAADGQIATVGFNTLWHSRHNLHQPFCNGGGINRSPLHEAQQLQAEKYAQGLTDKLSLRGLNCIDYVLSAGNLVALEVNPRPSATMQLYPEMDLFSAHCTACWSGLPQPTTTIDLPCAHAIIYAPHEFHPMPEMFMHQPNKLTKFCDIPMPDVTIRDGEPICSLRATAPTINTSAEVVINALQDAICQTTQMIKAI